MSVMLAAIESPEKTVTISSESQNNGFMEEPLTNDLTRGRISEDEKNSLIEKKVTPMDFNLEEERRNKMKGLWVVDGQVYDLNDFVKRHPGGSAAIGLGKGIDCTELFKTYHLMRSPPESILSKYRLPNTENFDYGQSKYLFEKDGFLMTVRQRVREYFNNNNLNSKGPIGYQIVAVLSIFLIMGLYYPAYIMGSLIASFALGIVKGITAVTAGHSMSHFSLFTKPWLNSFVFRACSPLVLSTHQIWSTSHIVSHHVHTLTQEDLQDNYPVKRVQPSMPFKWFHRYQHFYIWLVYILGLPIWTLADFFESIPVLFTGRHVMRQFTIFQRLENTLSLGTNIFLTLLLPFFFLPFGWALLVFLCSNVPASLMLVIQIAVNHEVPDTMSKTDPNNEKIDWGSHQVLTSHNFGVDSKFALHMSGGLNMQVEHHLFPSVHYTHYPAISQIVQQACKEFNLPYNTSKNIFEAVYKHYLLLKMNSKG